MAAREALLVRVPVPSNPGHGLITSHLSKCAECNATLAEHRVRDTQYVRTELSVGLVEEGGRDEQSGLPRFGVRKRARGNPAVSRPVLRRSRKVVSDDGWTGYSYRASRTQPFYCHCPQCGVGQAVYPPQAMPQ